MPVKYFPILFVFLWATGFIGAGLAMPYAEPFIFMTVRFGLAAAVLGVWAVCSGSRWPSGWALVNAAIVGCLIHGVYLSGVFWAVRNGLPAGMTALVSGLQPLMTTLIAALVLRESVRQRQWLGLLIGFVGVVLVVAPKFTLDKSVLGATNPYTLGAALTAVFAISIGTVWQKRFATAIDLKTGTTVQYIAAGFLTGILSILFETQQMIWSPELIIAMIWLVFVLSIGAVFLLLILIRQGAVSQIASLFYLVPVTAAILAYFLFGETLSLVQLIGMAATTVGVAMATYSPRVSLNAQR